MTSICVPLCTIGMALSMEKVVARWVVVGASRDSCLRRNDVREPQASKREVER